MAGLQTILNYCNGLAIDRRKVVGIQYTRNEIPRVSGTPTKNPWKFTLDIPNRFRYNEARDLMEALDTLDRITPEVITFSNLTQLNWIFRYRGAMTSGQISAITVSTFVSDQLILTNLPSVSAGTVLFEPNDLIQIGSLNSHPYPFTSTTQVLRGSLSTVTVTTNRPNIITAAVATNGIIVGNACQFNMFCPNMPTYKLTPGGYQLSNNTVVGNAILEFSDSFQLYEFVGTA
jgi:hypothetical protein